MKECNSKLKLHRNYTHSQVIINGYFRALVTSVLSEYWKRTHSQGTPSNNIRSWISIKIYHTTQDWSQMEYKYELLPAGKYLFKVSKITLEQRSDGHYFTDFEQAFARWVGTLLFTIYELNFTSISNRQIPIILPTLNRYFA